MSEETACIVEDDAIFQVSDNESTWEDDSDIISSSPSQNEGSKTFSIQHSTPSKHSGYMNAESEDIFSSSDIQLTMDAFEDRSIAENLDKTSFLTSDSIESETLTPSSNIKCTTDFSETCSKQEIDEMSSSFASAQTCTMEMKEDLINYSNLHGGQALLGSQNVCTFKNMEINNPHQSFIATVVNRHPVKEIWLKSKACWTAVCVIILMDFNGISHRLTLWGEKCKHSFNMCFGDILFLSKISVKQSFGDIVMCMTHRSHMINLGHAKLLVTVGLHDDISEHFLCTVRKNAKYFLKLYPLCTYGILRSFLYSENLQAVQLIDRRDTLHPGETVNINVYIMGVKQSKNPDKKSPILIYVSSDTSISHLQPLLLHGSATKWVKKLRHFHVYKWYFTNLICCDHQETGRVELHTTIFSSADCLFDSEPSKDDNDTLPVATSFNELFYMAQHGSNKTVLLKNLRVSLIKSCSSKQPISGRISQKQAEHWITDFQTTDLESCHMRCFFEKDKPRHTFKACCGTRTIKIYVIGNDKKEKILSPVAELNNLLEKSHDCKAQVTQGLDTNGVSLGLSIVLLSITK